MISYSKETGSSNYTLFENAKQIGMIRKDGIFSNDFHVMTSTQNLLFKRNGIWCNSFLIIDTGTNNVIGTITSNGWTSKQELALADKKYLFDNVNSFSSSSRCIDSNNTIRYTYTPTSMFSSSGVILQHTSETEDNQSLILLSGLMIRNQVMANSMVVVFICVMVVFWTVF